MKHDGLEILAQKIGQEIDEKNAELEACDIEVPKEYHNEMLAFIEKLDRESTRKEKKQASKRWLRAASIFMICFITLNGAALSTSEAYRQKVFSLFYDEEQGGVNLNFDPGHELLEEWEDYWYPAWIPEGYYLYAAEQIEDSHFLVFFSENMEDELRIITHSADSHMSFDTDRLTQEDLDIGIYDGYYFFDDEQALSYVVWGMEEDVITIENIGDIDKGILVEIAESMKKMK